MIDSSQKKLEEILLDVGLLTRSQLDAAKLECVRSGKKLIDFLISNNYISKEDGIRANAISINVPYVDLSSARIDQEVLKKVPKSIAKRYLAIPFGLRAGSLNVAMKNPNDIQAIEFIERKSGMRVVPYMASEENINKAIDQYQDLKDEVSEAIGDIDSSSKLSIKVDEEVLGELSGDAPVTRAVNTILEYAGKAKASDVHIEPWKDGVKVRFRIDGVLQETMTLPSHIHPALISRIKILSNLKIDEHRVPQDGRFEVLIEKIEIDIRVSISPTIHGEKVVMRLLNKGGEIIDIEKLGIRDRAFKIIEKAIKSPQGMILSTGPTGSGKTTTLYAILNKINNPKVNIITLEDPVEYQVKGINQIQINASVGLTFASGLRSVLRQDPDIIMVGEIRDAETAKLATQSALTGHLVLSTLHTNSASGILPRLLDMEVEPFLIASTVSVAMAQRLVKRLCQKCKKPYRASESEVKTIKEVIQDISVKKDETSDGSGYKGATTTPEGDLVLFSPSGCQDCNNSGFSGRIGLYEVFEISSEIEKLVVGHATSSAVQEQAIKEGMVTMREDGVLKVLEGETTLEEVFTKVTDS